VDAKLSDYQTARQALADLHAPFAGADDPLPRFRTVSPDRIPQPFRKLLVHQEHMTAILQGHYGRPVRLKVLRQRREGDCYRRQIALTLDGGRPIVEYGIVRIDLRYMPEDVRKQILGRRAPLGDVLIAHDVLRQVQPRWFLRFPEGFARADGPLYGRVGTIYVQREPAIELLEVVTGA